MEREYLPTDKKYLQSVPGHVVYFLHFPEMNLVRIGETTDLYSRYIKHRSYLPGPVYLLKWVPGGKEREASIEQMLKDFFKRNSGGSWYYAADFVLSYIERLH